MVRIYRFSAIRPDPAKANAVASVPYDVLTSDEAREIIAQNPRSFLRVSRPDAELPDLPAGDERIYARARQNFNEMLGNELFLRDKAPGYYLYQVTDGGSVYTGLVCCVGVGDYRNEIIRRHELTRYDKEQDRTRHIDAVNANTGLVFLVYRDDNGICGILENLVAALPEPVAEAVAQSGAVHRVFRVTGGKTCANLEGLFADVPRFYIADGHHRAASAVNVAELRAQAGTATPEAMKFMAVLFANTRVRIFGYSRMVKDLFGHTPASFLKRLSETMAIFPYGPIESGAHMIPPRYGTTGQHIFHMCLQGHWYELVRDPDRKEDLIRSLDVSVLQNDVLEGILGIQDSRGDMRLAYMGGVKPLSELETLITAGEYAVGFAMQPLAVEKVLAVSDSGLVMPPKSTWFEPKLLSGLLIHSLE